MGQSQYNWGDSELPIIKRHSLAKHLVLESYLERYISKLTSNPRRKQLKLTLIDGFAGGGIYRRSDTNSVHFGSPLLMLKAMRVAEAKLSLAKSKPFHLDVEFFFVEKNRVAFSVLQQQLKDSPDAKHYSGKCHTFQGSIESKLPEIIRHIKKRHGSPQKKWRAIFLLDQYGWIQVPIPTVRSILHELPNAEILLNFATDGLINHMSKDNQTVDQLGSIGIDVSSEVLDRKTEMGMSSWRMLIENLLHAQIRTGTKANYYTPFFIRPIKSSRAYWFLHLSNHRTARNEMVEIHWNHHSSFAHHGTAGLNMLGFEPKIGLQKKFDFRFDKDAELLTREALLIDLPPLIREIGPIPFGELFAKIANESPAKREMIIETLWQLVEDEEVTISNENGKRKGRTSKISDNEIIQSTNVRRFLVRDR